MSLLELEGVSKRYTYGARDHTTLQDVSLELHQGELVGIWGLHDSGRSTILRIAAGIEPPDKGIVRLDGHDLAKHRETLGNRIGYCHPALTGPRSQRHVINTGSILSSLITAQLARGVPASLARENAQRALRRTDTQHCAQLRPRELNTAEAVRVSIAQALTSKPDLLVIDEPTKGVDLLARDPILALLRSIADQGKGVLISVGETTGLFGTDRALALDQGELHGTLTPKLAPVIQLPQRVSA